MTNRKKRPEPGKWGWWKFFRKDPSFHSCLPATAILTFPSFCRFVQKYGAVFIKPNGAHRGEGIIKVWTTSDGYALVREQGNPVFFASLDSVYQAIREDSRKGKYVIQRAIELAKFEGRPFDFRIMMMKDTSEKWKYIGMLARIARKDCVITNARRGHGQVVPAETALKHFLKDKNVDQLQKKMIDLSYKICRRLDDYKHYWKAGIDLAIDENGKLWMLEANTWPGIRAFSKLPDKTTYRKIKSLQADYLRKRRENRMRSPKR